MSNSTWFGTPFLEAQSVKICKKLGQVVAPWLCICFTRPWKSNRKPNLDRKCSP